MSKSFHPLVDSHVLAILLKCFAELGTPAANPLASKVRLVELAD